LLETISKILEIKKYIGFNEETTKKISENNKSISIRLKGWQVVANLL